MKPIPTRVHGIIDYVFGLLLMAIPYLLGFADGGMAHWTTMTFGAAAVLYSLLTRYELGLIRLIPMPVHLGLDIASGLLLMASPWLFGFADWVWWPHALFGLVSVIVPLLTQRQPSGLPGRPGATPM